LNLKMNKSRFMLGAVLVLLLLGMALVPAMTAFAAPAGTVTPNTGPAGTIFTVSGTGFTPNVSGDVWFDVANIGVKDPGEPQIVVTTNAAGTIVGTPQLGVPAVAAAVYSVQFDIPTGAPPPIIEASTNFTVTTTAVTLAPNNGAPGTVINVTLAGFAGNAAGSVWFDSNSNGTIDAGEPSAPVTTDAAGALPAPGVNLTCPVVPGGNVPVQADIPVGAPIEGSTNFNVTAAITLTPSTAPPATPIAITGGGFGANQPGWVWFDSNSNGVRDPLEPQVGLSTDANGAIPAGISLNAPSVGAGAVRPVQADLPAGAAIEAAANFTEATPGIVLAPNTGLPGTAITITGTGFALNTAGWVWFDSNSDGVRDPTEPQVAVTSTGTGTLPAGVTLNAPDVAGGGAIPVQADIPTGGGIEATANFTVNTGIILTPNTGPVGTAITVTGGGFGAAALGWVWFDTDNDSVVDATEPQVAVTTSATGGIPAGVNLTVPAVAGGPYNVLADLPTGAPVEATAPFTVTGTNIAVTPNNGPTGTVVTITGNNFLSSTAGFVWFDADSDGIRDATETSVGVTTTATGAIPAGTTLTIPNGGLAAGAYPVQADIPTGGAIEAFANFTVTSAPPPPPPPACIPPCLYNAADTVTLAKNASVDIIPQSADDFMGTLCITSNATGYDVRVYTGTAWITVVETGAVRACSPVSGFGLRISNDTTATKTLNYVVVYLK
jgi:hypothetical protein